jgi:hypothetical protein
MNADRAWDVARRPLARADAWFFEPAPAARLARFRILVGLFGLAYLLVRLPVFAELGDRRDYSPVGVLSWRRSPFSGLAIHVLLVVTILSGVGFSLGRAFRLTGPLFGITLLILTTYRSSHGQLLWFENLPVLHTLIVGFARAADARTAPGAVDVRYGWPLRLAAAVTVCTYVLAGVAKLRIGGIGWISGESLRNHVAYSATRLRVLGGTPSPLARPLVDHVWIFGPLAVLTVIIELGAPVALLWARCRWVWALLAWSMHVAIAATMFVVFPYPLSFVAFAPMFALERAPRRGR